MNDIDTAAIRAEFNARWYEGHTLVTIHALCDALDAARADLISVRIESRANAERLLERIEAAEAERDLHRENARLYRSDLKRQTAQLDVYRGHCNHEARAEAAEARVELLETTWVNDDTWRHMEDRAMAAEAEAADLNDQLQDALGAEGTHWARITEALKLHQPSQGMCETCGTDYPCLTRRALRGGLDA